MRALFCLVIAAGLFFCSCESGNSEDESFIIMSWNVQNLFDDVDNGTEYREYDPANGEWDYDDFSRKVEALAEVIIAAAAGGPDIVLLQEVENENALVHLNDNYLKDCDYTYSLFLPTAESAIGCGVLSRLPISGVSSHSVMLDGKAMGRNISAVDFAMDDNSTAFRVFVNHWKSKLGGAEETEPARLAAAEMLGGLMKKSVEKNAALAVIAAGDFNESHDEFRRTEGSYPTALCPVSALPPDGVESALGLLYSSDPDDVAVNPGTVFFNPWSSSEFFGSYFYSGCWETIDQFFCTAALFDGTGWEYSGFSVAVTGFNSTSEGYPLEWRTSSSDGYSDHYPVLLELKRAE